LLNVANDNFSVLFDDYIERPFYGITKFIDDEIKNNFDTTLIQTEEVYISQVQKQKHGMIWFDTSSSTQPLFKIFPTSNVNKFLNNYRRYEKFITINRYKLNTQIPFLKNIKFKFWKKNGS